MNESLRPRLITRGRLIAFGAFVVAILVVTVVVPRVLAARHARERAALDEAMAPYLAEAEALTKQLAVRLSPIAALDAEAPATCPANVQGDVPLVQRPWLVFALDPSGPYPKVKSINSPAFEYFANQAVPGIDLQLLAKRNALYRALLAAPYVVISAIGKAAEMRTTGEATFEGGAIAAELFVVDVAAARIVCRTSMTSQPELMISVRQDSGAFTSDDQAVMADAFWDEAQKQLAQIAPAARLLRSQR